MSDRDSNVVPVSVDLIQRGLRVGNEFPACRLIAGPGAEAKLVNVSWAGEWIMLEYDRPVDPPSVQALRPE